MPVAVMRNGERHPGVLLEERPGQQKIQLDSGPTVWVPDADVIVTAAVPEFTARAAWQPPAAHVAAGAAAPATSETRPVPRGRLIAAAVVTLLGTRLTVVLMGRHLDSFPAAFVGALLAVSAFALVIVGVCAVFKRGRNLTTVANAFIVCTGISVLAMCSNAVSDDSPRDSSTSAAQSANVAGQSKTVLSNDGLFELHVPADWRGMKQSPELNEDATLLVQSRNGTMAVVGVSEAKTDFDLDLDLAGYASLIRSVYFDEVKRGELVGGPKPMTIDGRPALLEEVRATAEGINVNCTSAVIEGRSHYHLVRGCTSPSKIEKERPTLLKIIRSFRGR